MMIYLKANFDFSIVFPQISHFMHSIEPFGRLLAKFGDETRDVGVACLFITGFGCVLCGGLINLGDPPTIGRVGGLRPKPLDLKVG